MNKMLICLICIGAYPYTQLFQQELNTYQSQFKQIPLISSTSPTTAEAHRPVLFHQKVGFKKKRVEYTLALRY